MAEERPLRTVDEHAGHQCRPFGRAYRASPSIVAAAVVVILVLVLSPTISGTRSGPSPGDTGSASPGSTLPYPIKHVFVIVLENVAFSKALTLPFMGYLARTYSVAENFYATCHPSAPNYLAMTAGEPFQCGSNRHHVYDTSSIADLVQDAGLSWDGFYQTMPHPCDTHGYATYSYAPNAFVYYSDIVNNPTRCDTHDLPLTNFYADITAGTLPNYAVVLPNLTNQGHTPSTPAYASNFLHKFLSPLINDSFFQSSVFFITYDEGLDDQGYTAGGTTLWGGHTYLVAVSPYTKHVDTYPTKEYTPDTSDYNLLTTSEWLLGITPQTLHYASWTAFPPMKGLFKFPTAPAADQPATARPSAAEDGVATAVAARW
ncbi:MAG: alkaline phosphatase family protein [Thermoplasmata archaeon]